LLLETLRYSDEVKAADKIFSDIPDVAVDKDMLSLAEELIERKSKPFEPEVFKSQYTKALRALIEEKRKTGHVSAVTEEELDGGRSNVIDLMEALKRSVAKDKGGARAAPAKATAKKKTTKRKTAKRAAG
jgi:DNA end-binding protein Ku